MRVATRTATALQNRRLISGSRRRSAKATRFLDFPKIGLKFKFQITDDCASCRLSDRLSAAAPREEK